MSKQETIKSISGHLEKINEYQVDSLISRPEWGAITFESIRDEIELVLSIARDLSNLDLNYLPLSVLENIKGALPPVLVQLEQINGFSLEGQGDPSQLRANLSSQLSGVSENISTVCSIWIPYLAYKRGGVSENINRLNHACDAAESKLAEAEQYAENKKEEVEKIVTAAREASARAGVGTFTQEFDAEAKSLGTRSWFWLGAASVGAALTIGTTIFWPTPDESVPWPVLRGIFSKISVIAVLFTASVWCGQVYRALLHQKTVNRHRALSLRTFQAFVNATENYEVRDTVLKIAASSIFANTPTGLAGSKGSGSDAGSNSLSPFIGRFLANRTPSE